MADNGIMGLIKEVPQVLSMVYADLAQPGIQSVGKALGTVLEFSTSFLLPLKLQNEKFKLNFEKRLNEYKQKLEQIPDEKIQEVNPQIGTPLLEKLSYTTNDEIADLFTTLLTNASNSDAINKAHPAFIQMIERISCDEARIIKYLKGKKDFIPYCSLKCFAKDGKGYYYNFEKTTTLTVQVDLIFSNNIKVYLDNLVSLGVITDMNGSFKVDENIYKSIIEAHKINEFKEAWVPHLFSKVEIEKSYYQITDFGRLFIEACTIYK